jgi:hypothetical protein
VASLHHMLLADALRQARMSLRPGGRIVIVGLARETPADTPRSLISLALNPLVGLLRHPRRAELPPSHMRAPTTAADDSFDEIRHIAQTVLPGICLRRRLFWRYTATWTQPAQLDARRGRGQGSRCERTTRKIGKRLLEDASEYSKSAGTGVHESVARGRQILE